MNSLEGQPARVPMPKRPRRMERLATLPLFFPLEGRRVVVIGGTRGRGVEGRAAIGRRRERRGLGSRHLSGDGGACG